MSVDAQEPASRSAKAISEATLLVAGMFAIVGFVPAAAFILTIAPWATAVFGAVLVALQWTRYRGPGIFRAITGIWGFGLLVSGLYLGIGSLMISGAR